MLINGHNIVTVWMFVGIEIGSGSCQAKYSCYFKGDIFLLGWIQFDGIDSDRDLSGYGSL